MKSETPTLRSVLISRINTTLRGKSRRLGAALWSPSVTPEFSFERRSRVHRPGTTNADAYTTAAVTEYRMLADKQQGPTFSSLSPSGRALWKGDTNDTSTLFFPANYVESTTPETFLELDPAGFFTHSSATKGSCVSSGLGRMPTPRTAAAMNCWMEPSREPCTDEIPWTDLVFWLGNASTGEVVCSCAQCTRRALRGYNMRQQRYSPYQPQQQRRRVSSRVPVINLPRIEGVN